MYDVKQTPEEAAARLGLPVEFTRMHHDAGYHVCVDGRHYTHNCLITDPDCHGPALGYLRASGLVPADRVTYDEALELAARLYGGYRIADMAMHGYPQYELPRVPEPDRPAMADMIAEIKTLSNAITAVTRRGRAAFRGLDY